MLFKFLYHNIQVQRRAGEMLQELEASFFEVVLIPANPEKHAGHSLRALQSANPVWYSRLCNNHLGKTGQGRRKRRRPRTYISRKTTLKALARIKSGDYAGVYADRLLLIIRGELEESNKPLPDFSPAYVNGFKLNPF